MGDLGSHHQHANVCPKRPWRCQYLLLPTMLEQMSICPMQCSTFPEPCPNRCEAGTVERCVLERHLATECPLQLVACEFSRAGCTEKVPRKDLARHKEAETPAEHVPPEPQPDSRAPREDGRERSTDSRVTAAARATRWKGRSEVSVTGWTSRASPGSDTSYSRIYCY